MLSELDVLASELQQAEGGLRLHEAHMDRLSRRYRSGDMNFCSEEQVAAEFKAAESELYQRRKEVRELELKFNREALRVGDNDLNKARLCADVAREKADKRLEAMKGPAGGPAGGSSGIGGERVLWDRAGGHDEIPGR